jgi:hypothetical protein
MESLVPPIRVEHYLVSNSQQKTDSTILRERLAAPFSGSVTIASGLVVEKWPAMRLSFTGTELWLVPRNLKSPPGERFQL